MDDARIIELYFSKNQRAIFETEKKYGKYCSYIAARIVGSEEEGRALVNEAYLKLWNSIPPARPRRLKAFIAKITRNIAINRLDYERAQKRSGEALPIDEFFECLPAGQMPIEDDVILKEAINSFLSKLDMRTRKIFLRRYFYSQSVKDIAKALSLSENHVSVILHRTREKFKEYLIERGVFV